MSLGRSRLSSCRFSISQAVYLNFNGLTWPNVSVATLVPDHIIVPWLGQGR